jgi:hypothetical protein
MCTGRRKSKTHSKLVIHTNAVLPSPIADEGLQSVARRHAEVLQIHRDLQLSKFPAGDPLDILKSPDRLTACQSCRLGTAEGDDHSGIVTRCVTNIKIYLRRKFSRRILKKLSSGKLPQPLATARSIFGISDALELPSWKSLRVKLSLTPTLGCPIGPIVLGCRRIHPMKRGRWEGGWRMMESCCDSSQPLDSTARLLLFLA